MAFQFSKIVVLSLAYRYTAIKPASDDEVWPHAGGRDGFRLAYFGRNRSDPFRPTRRWVSLSSTHPTKKQCLVGWVEERNPSIRGEIERGSERLHDGQPDQHAVKAALQQVTMVLDHLQAPQRPYPESKGRHAAQHLDGGRGRQRHDAAGKHPGGQESRQAHIAQGASHQSDGQGISAARAAISAGGMAVVGGGGAVCPDAGGA